MRGALLVAGATSDAGKSVLTAGICRWLARQGVSVAPFKAQNMSLNSYVTADGAEIGRAQAMQAQACGVTPEAVMNPVLLKPGSDTHSEVVVLGRPWTETGAVEFRSLSRRLAPVVRDALADLRARFDVVICEGAGSPAEINLRPQDLANMGLARSAQLPVIVVGDIDRGGVLAALFGTLAVLDVEDQRLISGFVINKFRGDARLLANGLSMLRERTGRQVLGVVPWHSGLWLDAEDSLDLDSRPRTMLPRLGEEALRVAVLRLPRLSNVTDFDPLAAEPGVDLRLVATPAELAEADLVIMPGTRATVRDLDWLRATGLAEAIAHRVAEQRPVLGICGGFQMLAQAIDDPVESRRGAVAGLGLLPTRVEFGGEKVLARHTGQALGERVDGYLIHHGRVRVEGGEPFLDGCVTGAVAGTTWHGIFEADGFRRAFLSAVAASSGRRFVVATDVCFAAVRERRLDLLADLVAEHLDTDTLVRLIEYGPPPDMPVLSALLG
jgi:adenosylcobyric acid synthase